MEQPFRPPVILREGDYKISDLDRFQTSEKIWEVKDMYRAQLAELFEIQNPSLVRNPDFSQKQQVFVEERCYQEEKNKGNWIYFPWSGILIHSVSELEYKQLRTNRNQNLITKEEQGKLADFTVAIVGLSVGSNIALNLAYSGIGKTLKLSDLDTLETTNLNRVRARIDQVSEKKIEISAKQIYEIDPYIKLQLYPEGLSETNMEDFVTGLQKPSLIFEIIDDFKMKIRLRLKAREKRIPLIMLTNLGDSILVDIERYDLDQNMLIFNGLIGDIGEEILTKEISKEDEKRYAVEIVDKENVPPRALTSLTEIGKTLIGRPQLISTVSVSGGFATYLARQIALGEPLASGRKSLRLNDVM